MKTPSRFFWTVFFWGCAAAIIYAIAIGGTASAQITKTARAELTDSSISVPIGPHIYVTPDPDGSNTLQSVITKHKNNLRGTRTENNVVHLGDAYSGYWLLFSVANNSSREDWILSLGGPFDGRYGLASDYTVQTESGFTFTGTDRRPLSEIQTLFLKRGNVAVKIPKGESSLFAVFIRTSGGFPQSFAPSLVHLDAYYKSLQTTPWWMSFTLFSLMAAGCFFLAVSYLQNSRGYMLFTLYYALFGLLVTTIDSAVIPNFSAFSGFNILMTAAIGMNAVAITYFFLRIESQSNRENLMALVMSAGLAICGAAAYFFTSNSGLSNVLACMPLCAVLLTLSYMSFLQVQKTGHGAYFLAGAWLTGFIGTLAADLAALNIIRPGPITLNLYLVFLLPQFLLFVLGTNKRITLIQEEKRTLMARESRAAQSLAKLKQSKESADQTRLLRVIERERELMAELREREMQRTEEMRWAKEQADAANRAKSAFLAVVSHEIRTPMTGIMGVLRLLKETKLSKDQGDYILTIQKSGDAMMSLLNDILDFEKIETGNMQLEAIDFDLPKLVQGVVTLMSGHAADKGIFLRYEIDEDFPRIFIGDPTRLRQVLLNLVSNALKFTRKGGVTLRLRAAPVNNLPQNIKGDYEVYFAVEDTGIGIAMDTQETLFNPFQQADTSVARKYGGSGLGLAICQRLVEAMGGSIRLQSEPGKGSTFFFSLLMQQGQESNLESLENQGTSAFQVKTPPMKILVIEDNEINRKVLQNFLEKDKHNVVLCDRGENAIEQLEKTSFDLVFTDIKLPGMNGYETARTIRTLPNKRSANVPIIAITGNVSPEDIQACYDAGINDFIGKPIDYDRLMQTLAEVHAGKYDIAAVQTQPQAKSQFAPNLPKEEKNSLSAPEENDFEKPPIHSYLNKATLAEQTSAQNEDHWKDAKIFDLALADGLLKSLGIKQTHELMQGFIAKNDEIAKALAGEKEKNNFESIHERAHELKGMAANFGLKELASLASVIEKASQQKDLIRTTDSLETIQTVSQRANASITGWLRVRQSEQGGGN